MSYAPVKAASSEWTDEEVEQMRQEYFMKRLGVATQGDTLQMLYSAENLQFRKHFGLNGHIEPKTTPWMRHSDRTLILAS